MSKFKKTDLRAGVKRNTAKMAQEENSFGYLNLPDTVKLFKVESTGKVRMDFLPYIVKSPHHPDADPETGIATQNTLWYKLPFKVHRNIGVENDAVVCPTTFGKKCPICEYHAKRRKDGAEKEELDAWKVSKRNLYVVVPIGHKKMDEVPHVWDVSDYLFQQLLNKELLEDDDYAGFANLEDGLTLEIRFEEESLGKNKYYQANRIDFKPRVEAWDESILDDVPCLDELLIILSYRELEAKAFELEMPETVEEEPEPAPRRSRAIPEPEPEPAPRRGRTAAAPASTRSKPIPEPEPEEYEEEYEEEEPEPEPAPRRGRTAPAQAAAPAPRKGRTAPAPEPEEDDEPEPTPAPRRGKPAAPPPAAKAGKGKCPFGHVFGQDADVYPDCVECTVWDDCVDG